MHLAKKQVEFNAAMERYTRGSLYRWFTRAVSFANVVLQLWLGYWAFITGLSFAGHLVLFGIAYVLADFVNGCVHMYMDNSETYEGPFGPFYAAFHLHHRTPRYTKAWLPIVYFRESGTKTWLAIVQLITSLSVFTQLVPGAFICLVFYFSILSSLAEVSHYLCHMPQTRIGKLLGKCRILLPSRYHARHHREDNVQYAFLNGMTDPLIDLIAKRFYAGYKRTTDTHYARYSGKDSSNRIGAE